jgi:hypothetical protein
VHRPNFGEPIAAIGVDGKLASRDKALDLEAHAQSELFDEHLLKLIHLPLAYARQMVHRWSADIHQSITGPVDSPPYLHHVCWA